MNYTPQTKNIENENSQELYDLHQKNTGKIISESNIKTEALQIRTDSISGNSEYYVLVTHTGFNSNDALTISFESEFVKDRSELYTSNNMKLIEDDLIIEFAPNNNKEISYYVKGISTLDNINNLEYVNTKPNVKNSQTTGFSISNTTDLIKNNFLFVLIGLLFMVYVFYNFEVGDKIKDVSVKTINRMQNKNMTKDAKEMIQEIRDAKKIVNENLNDAKKTYSKVMINYQGLTGKEKEHVYHDAISLHKAILEKNMDEIMNHVDSHLDKGDKKSAKIYLERLEQLYNGLEPNLKEKLKYKVVLANMNYNSNKNNN